MARVWVRGTQAHASKPLRTMLPMLPITKMFGEFQYCLWAIRRTATETGSANRSTALAYIRRTLLILNDADQNPMFGEYQYCLWGDSPNCY